MHRAALFLSQTVTAKMESISAHVVILPKSCYRNYSWHNLALVAHGKNRRSPDFNSNRFGVSLIAQMIIVLISFGLDLVLLYHLGPAVILAAALGLYFQAVLLQIAMSATGETLPAKKAYILSLLVVPADVFVASPLVARINAG
jgi:hypothetical protein